MTQQQNCDAMFMGVCLLGLNVFIPLPFQDLSRPSPTQPGGQASCLTISGELSLGLWSALAQKSQDGALLPVSGSPFTH